jgi:hypothetical protein
MTRAARWTRLAVVAGLTATLVNCGDASRRGDSGVLLVVDAFTAQRGGGKTNGAGLSSDVITNVTEPAPCTAAAPCPTVFSDSGIMTVRSMPKDITVAPLTPSYMDVTLTRYHVNYRRADGRNTPGVDVPYPFDGGLSVTIPAGAKAEVVFELVRHVAKEESPLVELRYNARIITAIADVTLYGRDIAGNIVSAAGSITIDFGDFGDQ